MMTITMPRNRSIESKRARTGATGFGGASTNACGNRSWSVVRGEPLMAMTPPQRMRRILPISTAERKAKFGESPHGGFEVFRLGVALSIFHFPFIISHFSFGLEHNDSGCHRCRLSLNRA